MDTRLIVLTGPAGSGKTQRLLARYRSLLAENAPGAALWLAPHWRAVAEVRDRLLREGLPGCFSPAVTTFARFARTIVQLAPDPIRPISRWMKRQLLRTLLEEHAAAGRLGHFQPIAQTGGLLDLVGDFISELKRLEIWPEHFQQACAARGPSAKDAEFFDLYQSYQQHLRDNHLYDAEGLFWSARDWLSRGLAPGEGPPGEGPPGICRLLERLRLVVADGFTDFTRTQHEILAILAQRAEQLWISLPLEAPPRREELFHKPLRTLAELRRRHGHVQVEELPRAQSARWPARAHLEKSLFGDPRQAQPAAETSGLEFFAASHARGEIELVARRIKQWLVDGRARPGQVAVVFRGLREVGPLLSEVFARFGIPFAIEIGQPLDRAAALRALVALLQLDLEDWPWDRLLAVLGSNYFQPDWPVWRRADAPVVVQKVIRRLQIPRGRQRLLEELASGARPDSRPGTVPTALGAGLLTPPPVAEQGDRADAPDRPSCRLSLAVLRRLAAALDGLPARATLGQWAAAWQRLAEQTGLLRAMTPEEPSGNGSLPPDRLAWQRCQAALEESDSLYRSLQRQPPELDRSEALRQLQDMLADEAVFGGGDESGRVRVLSAASARGLQVPYVFLAGLAEKAFPAAAGDDRLYTQAEYQRLIDQLVAQGLPVVAYHARSCDEMLLFYEALTRATEHLWLSYPALDEAGQPLSPSPYLQEVEQACGKGRIQRTELTDLSPIPADTEPCCPSDLRVKAVADALEGDVSLLAGLLGPPSRPPECAAEPWQPLPQSGMAENLLAGLDLVHARQNPNRFSEAEGMLSSAAARAWLAAYYAPQRVFRVTELEAYASCPFQFFLERVLKLEAVEDLTLQVDFLRRGQRAHAFLAALHRRVNETAGRPSSPAALPPEQYDRLAEAALAEVLPAEPSNPLEAALWEIDRRLLRRWAADYRRQHEKYEELWQTFPEPLAPACFEVSFGRGGDATPPSTDRPLEFCCGRHVVGLSGRIDRIDLGRLAGRIVFNVLDYKTGKAPRMDLESVQAGTSLQLPAYALAAAELILADRDAIPWQAGYWLLSDEGFKPKGALRMYRLDDSGRLEVEESWEKIRGALDDVVAALVQRLRRGEFPVSSADDECTRYCPFRTVCRIQQVRALAKTWQPLTKDQ